ncbi:unnamed protein product [Cuscuta campestris]|uniref:Uncharacterized protein n=1 Tax=Cuscuta campestris TaxID=132261 RepID=A0A484MYV0_9ASTE|nr:unnamed protein product [Cuscuta campestris]
MVFYWWLHQVEIQYQLQAPLKDWHLKINVFVIQRSRPCKYGVDLAKQITSLHNILERCGSVRISFSRQTPEKANHLQKLRSTTHVATLFATLLLFHACCSPSHLPPDITPCASHAN